MGKVLRVPVDPSDVYFLEAVGDHTLLPSLPQPAAIGLLERLII